MNNDELVNYDVFIDVDALFDTRLPILFALSPTTMDECLKSGLYRSRVKDSFGDIPSSVFKGFYDNRDKRVLLAARPTEMFNLLAEYIGTTTIAMTSIGDSRTIRVYLNIYPYNLIGDEVDTILTLLDNIATRVEVEVVSFSNHDLTPKWIEKNVGVVIKYDSIEWVDIAMSYGTLQKTPLLETIMMGPHLITGDIDSKDVTQEVFNGMLESVNTLIGYSFIKTSYYCLMKK